MAFWRNLCESLSVSRNFKSISFSYLWFITIINWGSKFFWLVWSSTHRVLTHHLHSQLHTSRFDPWWRMRMDVLLNLPSSLGNVSIWRTDSWLMIRILVETFRDLNVEMVQFEEVRRTHTKCTDAHSTYMKSTQGERFGFKCYYMVCGMGISPNCWSRWIRCCCCCCSWTQDLLHFRRAPRKLNVLKA